MAHVVIDLEKVTKMELYDALVAVLPYAEVEAEQLAECAKQGQAEADEAQQALSVVETAQKIIDRAEGAL